MIIAGLTGGIATGKSTVSRMLTACGAIIVDADQLARHAVQQGRPAWQRIVAVFGKQVLNPDGELNRERLGDIVFKDQKARAKLNHIVHPEVTRETARRLNAIGAETPHAITVLDVPLLLEVGMADGLAEVIVVYVPQTVQLKRLIKRDGITPQQALARIRSQMPIEEKKHLATLVIDNSGSLTATQHQTERVFRYLKTLPHINRSRPGDEWARQIQPAGCKKPAPKA